VIADDVAAADHMNTDLVPTFHHPFTALEMSAWADLLVKDLEAGLCSPSRGVLLVAVVGLDHLDIVALGKAPGASLIRVQKMFTPTL